MHEMALLEKVVDIVLEEAQARGADRVTAVHLTFGELSDVMEDVVPGLFSFLARGTVAEGARVVIAHVPAYVQCRKCNEAWRIDVHDEATWTCPRCGAYKKYRLISGREFRIDSIEVEAGEAPDGAASDAVPDEAASLLAS